MIVLVTGCHTYRSHADRMWLYAGLDILHKLQPITKIISNGAYGFAHHAINWQLWREGCGDKIEMVEVRAEWERYSPGPYEGFVNPAGHISNVAMADLRPDVVLAGPANDVATDMIAVAAERGIKVVYLEKMPIQKPKREPVPEPPPIVIDAA